MLINDTDALRWLVCVVISLSLLLPRAENRPAFSALVFVLISARPKQREVSVLLAVLGFLSFCSGS